MAGYREFQTGEVLTAANVDDFLAKQAVMKFADAAARNTALGTAVGGSNALREGMVAYLDDTDAVEVFDGTAWGSVGGGGFTAGTAITSSDASWPVPTLADPMVKVTVIGAGGGGGAGAQTTATDGGDGGTTTFNAGGAGTVTAAGGTGGGRSASGNTDTGGRTATAGFGSANGGQGGINKGLYNSMGAGKNGGGGAITVAYLDLTGISTVNVSIGAGGTGGTPDTYGWPGNVGGRGEVIFEYRAG